MAMGKTSHKGGGSARKRAVTVREDGVIVLRPAQRVDAAMAVSSDLLARIDALAVATGSQKIDKAVRTVHVCLFCGDASAQEAALGNLLDAVIHRVGTIADGNRRIARDAGHAIAAFSAREEMISLMDIQREIYQLLCDAAVTRGRAIA